MDMAWRRFYEDNDRPGAERSEVVILLYCTLSIYIIGPGVARVDSTSFATALRAARSSKSK